MTYDPRTVFERYRLTARLSADLPRPDCALLADGLPPTDRRKCEALGCREACRSLAVVAKAAYEQALSRSEESMRDLPKTENNGVYELERKAKESS